MEDKTYMIPYEESELLNLTRENNFLLRQIYNTLNNVQNNSQPFEIDVLANLFAGLFNRKC